MAGNPAVTWERTPRHQFCDPVDREAEQGSTHHSRAVPRACLECGAVLPIPARTGRPRGYCRLSCLRAADRRRRMIRCRQEALTLWRELLKASRDERHPYSRELARRMVRELEAELYVLEHQHGRPTKAERETNKGGPSTFIKNTAVHWLARLDRDHHDELAKHTYGHP